MESWEKNEVILLWIWMGIGLAFFFVITIVYLMKRYAKEVSNQYSENKKKSEEVSEVHLQKLVQLQEDERSRIAGELHDNVISQLNIIRIQSLNYTESEIAGELTSSMRTIREVSHDLALSHISSVNLVDLISDHVERLKENIRVECTFSTNYYAIQDDQIKRDIFRIFQEVLNNSLKHSQATCLSIHVKSDRNYFNAVISDDGIGFDQNENTGFGLRNIELRTKKINAIYKIKSGLNKGSRFIIRLKMNE